jgi:hypothetical protein
MSGMETSPVSNELSIDQIYDEVLGESDYERAYDLHSYIVHWVFTPGHLSSHNRAMFVHMSVNNKIGSALTLLMDEFSRPGSKIAPTEPPLWIEWANYWQRGFDPSGPRHPEPSLDPIG